ncbi:MAG: lamin tail domain-containing protein [Candidatus Krumholzibacteriota bacterium]
MSSFRREITRAFRLLVFSLIATGVIVPAAVAAPADHLIISEVLIKTRTPYSSFGSPFIEIVNPTGSPIPMDNVYLTDGATAPSTYYYNIALLDPATANPGGGVGGDFHARFPTGFVLAAGDSIAISLKGSTQYVEAYGRKPDFELFEDGTVPDDVPELVEPYPGSINAGLGGAGNVPELSDQAESLVLYSWDGTSDLVQDLDYLVWGTNVSPRIDKTGVVIGGGTYLADTSVGSQEAAAAAGPTFGSVMRRVDADEGTEITTGGNGISGHDETSENLATTFPTVVGHEPPLANTPFPAAPIFTGGGFSPAEPADGQTVTLTASVVDQDEVTGVEFRYSVDGGAEQVLAGTPVNAEDWSATVPAQVENAVVSWYCVATNTEAITAVYPAGSPVFVSSWTVGPPVVAGDGPGKLLLTEISTLGTSQEFIEIYNPGNEEVDLSDYYLTDANYSSGDQYYYRIAEGNPSQSTVGGGDFADFHARFPAGFTITAKDTIVVTVAGSISFNDQFGFDPDLELWEDDGAPDDVPDMLPIFGVEGNNSIISSSSTPTLTNGAETVILYHFVTGEDKVTDIDVFAWKDPSSTTTSIFFNKTGVTVGSHSYLPENGTNVNDAFGTQNEFGNSYHRTDPTEGDQTPTGSNGVDGRDETSENFNTTFAMMPYDPSGPSGPPVVGEAAKLLISEVSTSGTSIDFIEINNPNNQKVDLFGFFLTDAVNRDSGQFYWKIAEGNPSVATIGGGADGDFHAQFPDGSSIMANGTIVVAMAGSGTFAQEHGFPPDWVLFDDGTGSGTEGTLEPVFGDAANNSIHSATSTPTLENEAETVVLYHFLAGEDKVTDVDVFAWKDTASGISEMFFDKTGETIGGHEYLSEKGTNESRAFTTANAAGNSYQREGVWEYGQASSGSNGVDGRDETSENFNRNFISRSSNPGAFDPSEGEILPVYDLPLWVPARTFLPDLGEEFPIRFAAPPSDESETRLRVFDLEGRVVVTLFDSRFDGDPPGSAEHPGNPILWDGRDSFFERVKAGMYVLHLSIVDVETGKMEEKTAPVVVGTRLSN